MSKRIQRLLWSALFLLFLFLNITPIFAQTGLLNNLDAYIEQAMKDWQVPGLAISIVKDDSLIFARGYGVREIGKEAKVDEHTIFVIASNSKAFTASLLGMLVEEEKISWDDKVADYMREFQMVDPYITREINIKDLLTHRSGLPTFGGDHLWIGSTRSREDIITRIRYLKPTKPFRTHFQYQNLMFLVAGELIPKITGQSWDEAMKERIFEPLGMVESMTTMRELKNKQNVAIPHEIVGGKVTPVAYDYMDNLAPAGGIKSNVVDMAQWMRLNLNGGLFKGKQILSSRVIKEMHNIQFPLPISSFSEEKLGTRFSGYGLGWGISDYKGRKMISHGGGLSGMISRQVLIPEENLGVIVLTNYAPNNLARALTYQILDEFLDEPGQDWSAIYLEQKKKADEKKKKTEQELQQKRARKTRPSLKLEQFTGKYFDKFSGEAEVRLENGKLVFDYNPRHIGNLEHWHYNTFRVIWRNPIFDMAPKSFLTFYLDEMGKVEKLKVTFYDPIYFHKLSDSK